MLGSLPVSRVSSGYRPAAKRWWQRTTPTGSAGCSTSGSVSGNATADLELKAPRVRLGITLAGRLMALAEQPRVGGERLCGRSHHHESYARARRLTPRAAAFIVAGRDSGPRSPEVGTVGPQAGSRQGGGAL